jgi:hypothetical protein
MATHLLLLVKRDLARLIAWAPAWNHSLTLNLKVKHNCDQMNDILSSGPLFLTPYLCL